MAKTLSSSDEGSNIGGAVDREGLRRYVSRAMALLDERDTITEDLKEVYEEAKEAGFVTKQLRQLVREQRMDADVRDQHLSQMDMLRAALGDFADSPLGAAAVQRAHKPKRGPGRPRKNKGHEALDRAEEHLEGEPLPFDEEERPAMH